MGQYFKIVNVSKKQFINIAELGENNKYYGVGQGLNGIALGRLMMSLGETDAEWGKYFGHPKLDRFYMGAWAGDRIIIAGDYDLPDTNGVQTSNIDDPGLNLYDKIEVDPSYKNVTIEVIKWLAKYEDTAVMLAETGKRDKDLLKILCDLVFVDNNELMKDTLEKVIGTDWTKLLK